MPLVRDVIKFLEKKFPTNLAYDWDNVGLQIGDINCEVKKMMVALDATTPVIDEAISKDVDLIITHHPFIFAPLKSIDLGIPQGKNIQKLIKNDIAIYAMHTNYDIAPGGMNDILAERIGLRDVKPFAMIDDVHGLGRIGKLEKAMNIDSFSNDLYEQLAPYIGVISNVECENIGNIETVAVIGGSGGKYIHDAKAAGADVLITGDVTYHIAIDAKDIGLTLLDIGHFAEVVMETSVADLIAEEFNDHVRVITSTVSSNPIV